MLFEENENNILKDMHEDYEKHTKITNGDGILYE